MKTLKEFQSTGFLQGIPKNIDSSLLHKKTTGVIMYKDGHFIELLSDGKFLYRPSGKGYGKRSLCLETVELFMYNQIGYSNTH
jgi:hypothetical protein